MLRKLNYFFNIVIGSCIGVFIGFGIYKFWHFKTYPNLYAMQSAPWYTELLLDGALVAVVAVVYIILKLVIWRDVYKRQRHNRAAQIVNLDITDGTCELRLSRSLHSQRFTLGIILHFQFSILHTEIDNQNFHKNRVRPHSTVRTLLFT